jgi:acyl dehydratase
VHPFTKPLSSLRIGDTIHAGPRIITLQDIEHFAESTGDTFYAHMDEEAAAKNPFFGRRVASGYLIVSLAAGLLVQPDYGSVLANYGIDDLRFLTPVKPGDEVSVTLSCKQISPGRSRSTRTRRSSACVGRDPAVEAKFRARLVDLGAEMVGPYVNSKTPVAVRCAAGHDCTPSPGSVIRGAVRECLLLVVLAL